MKALVVDDDDFARKLERAVLERAGFEVTTAESWAEVSSLVYSNEIAVILMDVEMPGLPGDRIVEILRRGQRGKNLPIFLISNLPEEELARRTEAAGADGWLQKPLTSSKMATLRRHLDRLDR